MMKNGDKAMSRSRGGLGGNGTLAPARQETRGERNQAPAREANEAAPTTPAAAAPRKNGMTGRGQRPGAAIPLAVSSSSSDGSMGYGALVGIFMLSALLGGGLAAVWLSLQGHDGAGHTTAKLNLPEAPSVTKSSVIVQKKGGNGQATISRKLAPPVTKETARSASAILPVSSSGSDRGFSRGADGADKARALARETERVVRALTDIGRFIPAPTGGREFPGSRGMMGTDVARGGPGAAEVERLTRQVVAALRAMNASPEQVDASVAQAQAERLRSSLAELVKAALAQGRSEEEIRILVSRTLESSGEGAVPAVLRDASGKLDVRRLLASVMPAINAAGIPMDADERAYLDQLLKEAVASTDANGHMQAAARVRADVATADNGDALGQQRETGGRFFFRNGRRYTIVRKGDTLAGIAYAAYGDMLEYPAILRANRGRISIHRLRPGTLIVIPDVDKTRRPGERKTAGRNKSRATGPARSQRVTKPGRSAQVNRRAAASRKGSDRQRRVAGRKKTSGVTIVPSGRNGSAGKGRTVKITNFSSSRRTRENTSASTR